ncbi:MULTISPECIES: L,D-transpeptidase family protein [unclassified Chamaesiphon]|uniref:L,D-transpeptidase family protein n=1 Tax=unclassified Chamaesiphon TaxID=2620921 RepID=UPI00286AA2B8|nr:MULTISPECIES: L,D-transpeptidase family protein [unclassified Chamaesiphon]
MNRLVNSFLLKSSVVLAMAIAILPAIATDRSSAEPASRNATTAAKSTPTSSNNTSTVNPSATQVATKSLPPIADINLVLQLKERKVYVYRGSQIVAAYPVAIGKKGSETPTGEWQVMETIVNPGWTNFNTGKMMPPGRNNPLGSRWIGFWTDGKDTIGFHGTNKPDSIGKAVSSGCVRMHDRDVQALYPLIKVGTIVRVVK